MHWSNLTGHGWWVGGLASAARRSTVATALVAELLLESDGSYDAADATGRRRPRGVYGRELGRVKLRAPGRHGVHGADDWMGGGRAVVVDPTSGALRLEGYTGTSEPTPHAEFVIEEVEPLRYAWLPTPAASTPIAARLPFPPLSAQAHHFSWSPPD